MKEYVQVVKLVWEGNRVEFDGEFFRVHNLTMGFKVKEKPVPMFVASLSPKTQAFAATVADGVILSPALNSAGVPSAWSRTSNEEKRRGERLSRGRLTC